MSVVKDLFSRDNVLIAMIGSLLLMLLGLHDSWPLWRFDLYIGATVLFASFDAYGHRYLLTRENGPALIMGHTERCRLCFK